MGFILGLPEAKNSNGINVTVDRFDKSARFIFPVIVPVGMGWQSLFYPMFGSFERRRKGPL